MSFAHFGVTLLWQQKQNKCFSFYLLWLTSKISEKLILECLFYHYCDEILSLYLPLMAEHSFCKFFNVTMCKSAVAPPPVGSVVHSWKIWTCRLGVFVLVVFPRNFQPQGVLSEQRNCPFGTFAADPVLQHFVKSCNPSLKNVSVHHKTAYFDVLVV